MIGYLEGRIVYKTHNSLILLVNSIGYEIFVPTRILQNKHQNEEIKLYIHHNINNESQSLFGFLDLQEKDFFLRLKGISKIGSFTAINILSSYRLLDIIKAIISEDHVFLQSIKGLGAKTAKRIILELKDKLHLCDMNPSSDVEIKDQISEKYSNCLQALIKLGISKIEAEKKLNNIRINHNIDSLDSNEILKLAFKT